MRYACLRNLFMKKRAGRVQRKMSVSIPGRRDCVSLERRDINFKLLEEPHNDLKGTHLENMEGTHRDFSQAGR